MLLFMFSRPRVQSSVIVGGSELLNVTFSPLRYSVPYTGAAIVFIRLPKIVTE